MRQHQSLFPIAAASLMAFVATVAVLLSPDFAFAGERKPTQSPPAAKSIPAPIPSPVPAPQTGENSCSCPQQGKDKLWARPKFAELPATSQRVVLDETDEIAALESVQFALSEVGDGASYIWHRNNGRLSGMVQPVNSFKDTSGQVCRHVVVVLTSGQTSKKAEGVACRLSSGLWQLEG
jgi:17 kDa outer membrane surface antigen